MAGKTTRVSVEIGAKITGSEDVSDLAKQLTKVPDTVDTTVAAEVTGTRDVSDLAADLDALPAKTTTAVDVDTSDLDALPKTTTTTVDVDVNNAVKLSDLDTDLKGLPATKTVRVDTTTTGNAEVDSLIKQLAGMDKNPKVSLSVGTVGAGKAKTELDGVKTAAQDARDETAGFASEMTGTLGGQFSEGAGIVSDFAEQFRNLRDRVQESDNKVGTVAKAAAGIGGTLLAGFGIDAIIGLFDRMNQAAETTKANVKALSDQIVESGGLIDANFQRLQAQQITEDPGFEALVKATDDYGGTLKALMGDTQAYADIHAELATKAQASAEAIRQSGGTEEQAQAQFQTVQTLEDMATKFDSAGDSAIKNGRAFANAMVDMGLMEDEAGKAANGVDLLGAAMQDNAKDTTKSTDKLRDWNKTDLEDKDATISATDKATGKVTSYNNLKVNEKTGTLSAIDTATGKVHTYNSLNINPKTGTLSAIDNATGKVTTFNLTELKDKTADIHGNTGPAEADIDSLNGRDVDVDVHARIANMTPAQQRKLFGEVVTGSYSGATPAPTVGLRTSSAPTVVAPITINVSGALDPAGTARAINQVLTRAQRRTGQLRNGGRFGVSRAPV